MMIVPHLFARGGAVAAMSTRRGGVSAPPYDMNLSLKVGDADEAVLKNRELFFGMLGVRLDQLAVPGQVHSATVRRADVAGAYPDCDGLITGQRGVFLCISVADCVPVLVFDPGSRTLGAFHAGWRGTAARICAAGVERLVSELGANPSSMLAFVGPAAGACCYEVGEEVAGNLDPRFVIRRGDRTLVDLKNANAAQLTESGLRPERIDVHHGCTIMDASIFHSYRRDGAKSGRMMAVVGLP